MGRLVDDLLYGRDYVEPHEVKVLNTYDYKGVHVYIFARLWKAGRRFHTLKWRWKIGCREGASLMNMSVNGGPCRSSR